MKQIEVPLKQRFYRPDVEKRGGEEQKLDA